MNVLPKGGGYPAASGVAMSNPTAGSVNLGVEVDAQDNLSGMKQKLAHYRCHELRDG